MPRDYNNLAFLLQNQRKYAEAEPLYRRAIEIDEKALGKDLNDVAFAITTISPACFRTRASMPRLSRIYRRTIEILESSLGPDHPNTLSVKTNYDRLLQRLNSQNSEDASR